MITGAAAGIGFACAVRCREAGADVFLVDFDAAAVAAARRRLVERPAPGRVAAHVGDVSEPSTADTAVHACVVDFGGVDVLVNNAGIYPTSQLEEVTTEHIRRVLSVNVESVISMTRAAALRMIEQGRGGAVVNLASVGALRGMHPGLTVYGASKGAVISFTNRAAGELGPRGVRVNAIAPGAIATKGAAEIDGPALVGPSAVSARIPLGRSGTPDDVATVAVFLASDGARYVTGVTIVVDGGALVV
jgi:3-oxoacyl-[acyl-carrier protein] reductase